MNRFQSTITTAAALASIFGVVYTALKAQTPVSTGAPQPVEESLQNKVKELEQKLDARMPNVVTPGGAIPAETAPAPKELTAAEPLPVPTPPPVPPSEVLQQ